ncbi:MAG: pilus assembly protein PilO [Okeania sp. SIO2F4]|uniref:pilus assembly protein PilO n=1 Tax=Okeania sp. SIO2F4 TaxID=2607790 RepID=UPI00142BE0A0|nr:pilus assembly protein PilO [Okeania sp. SIO2F4]MDJ0519567.1 pilus assembly protein PilO [Trichodesmium sp. MO_231.B1]NES03120.1 pilus assembly protein PilO [Okeania sp. SIO2F4]
MVVANEWNPELEEQEEEGGGPKILGISLKDPRFIGGAIGIIGLGIAGFLGYNQLKPAIEKSAELRGEINTAEVKIKEQKKQIKERPKAEAEMQKAEKQREDVTSLFASEKTMKTLLYDMNKLIDQINVGITDEDQQAKMTKFQPVEPKNGNYIVNDNSLGPLVNGKLKRREFKVEFEGSYPQTRAFMIAIERMQTLLVVKNLKTKLEQGNQVIEVEWKQNKFVPVSKPESRLRTSFDMHALLALSEQESLDKESSKKEDPEKK